MVIQTRNYLKQRFSKVEELYGKLLAHKQFMERLKPSELQAICNELKKIEDAIVADSATDLGTMYKSGIITGCVNALHILATELNIMPE